MQMHVETRLVSLLPTDHQSCYLLLAHPLNGGYVASSGRGKYKYKCECVCACVCVCVCVCCYSIMMMCAWTTAEGL